ncbi:hypothetical protein AB9P05_02215 [Roseivirga sp. BDSF3-8]|uniref:hypothetical protein n=1 Tax=Roseivirga sp. BDSF3-8 TaxID=3241598 RepID=UPI003531BB43
MAKYIVLLCVWSLVGFIRCSDKQEEKAAETSGVSDESAEARREPREGYKEINVGDSIQMQVPSDWQQVNSEAVELAFREDCDSRNCDSMIIYGIAPKGASGKKELIVAFEKFSFASDYISDLNPLILNNDTTRILYDYVVNTDSTSYYGGALLHVNGDHSIAFTFSSFENDKDKFYQEMLYMCKSISITHN